MTVCKTAYLGNAFCDVESARISPFDRGFLFAHAAYEVTAVYAGHLVDFGGHMARLDRTLKGIGVPNPLSGEGWTKIHRDLIAINSLTEGLIYLQVSAGAYGLRDFAGPETFQPTVFVYADARRLIGDAARDGIRAIFLDDSRWKRRDMKTTQLLSQALAYRTARESGAETAFLVEAGHVTEAASANAWIVNGEGQLVTRDLSPSILPGITRAGVLDLLEGSGLHLVERAFTPDEALSAKEAFTTSAGAMVAPVVAIDGQAIGTGQPGPVTRQIQRLYYQAMGADVAAVAPWAMG